MLSTFYSVTKRRSSQLFSLKVTIQIKKGTFPKNDEKYNLSHDL